MNLSRRVSKRKTSGASFTAEKRLKLTQPVDSFFTECMRKCGVSLSNGSIQHTISTDAIQFRKTLHEVLMNHQFDMNSTVELFVNEFEKYIENYARFHKLLLETIDESGGARRSFTQPSIIKLLLSINELQMGVAMKVINKLLDFSSPPFNTPGLATKDVYQIPKLILNQFRWLDVLVDGAELCDKLLEYVTLLPLDIQKDIIQSLPEILEDDQHPHAALKLKGISEDHPDLLTSCIDTWSDLNMDTDLAADILDLVMNQVKSANVEYLPVVLNYIMRQKFDGCFVNIVHILQEVRRDLDTVSCFTPIPTVTSTPHNINAIPQSISSNTGFVILDCIQNSLMRLKVIVNGWIKVIESIENESDHKLLDLFVLFVIHDLPGGYAKTVRNVFVNKVKNKKFSENILEQFFQHKIPNLKSLFPSILSVAKHLLSQTSPTINQFAQQLYKHAFAACDVFNQQDIIGTLVVLASSGSQGTCSLDIIEDLVMNHPKEVERFSVLIRTILDYLEYLDLPQIRKVYKILCMLAYGVSEDNDSGIQDEIEAIIRKQLHHSDQSYRHKGVIAAVMAVKQIAEKRTTTDNTMLGILSETNQTLSESRKEQVEKILEQVYKAAEKNHNTASLFFDEMAAVIGSCTIHTEVLTDMRDQMTDKFQEKFVSERSELTSDVIPVVYEYDLDEGSDQHQEDEEEEDDSSIAVNIVSFVVESINAIEKQTNDSKIEPLCSHFKLLRMLEQAVSQGLTEIDALLGCPVVLPDPKVLEADAFKKLEIEQKRIICATLFHCINWFRELVSAFASESEPDMKAKVLKRLAAITELQQNLNTCLMNTAGPIPTISIAGGATCDSEGAKRTSKKSKSKADVTMAISGTTQADNTVTASIKDTTIGSTQIKKTIQCDALQRLKSHFRELDLSAYMALSYERLPSSVLESNPTHDSSDIILESPQLLFLLQELQSMVSSLFSLFAAKKKIKSKSLHSFTKDREMAVQMSTSIIPALCNHLETINRFLQAHADDNDGILDKSIDSVPFNIKIHCFQLICKILTNFYNWPLLSDAFYEKELKESLQCFAGRVSQSSTQEDASLTLVTSKAFKYLERFTDMIPTIVPVASLCKVLVAIQRVTQVREIKTLAAEYCGRLLKRSWSDLSPSTNSTINEALESIVKVYIDWSVSPLEVIDDIHSNGITELLEEARDQSHAYPTLAIQTIGPYYRALSVALVTSLKNIPTINKDNLSSSQELVDSFLCLQQTTRLYNALVNLVKSFNIKSVLSSALKNGRLFVEAFIKNGIPMLDLLFRLKKDDVLGILKNLQQATRCLQHFCGHSKVTKDVTLTNYVPVLKKSLEMLIFSVKGVVVNNGCFEAFWMGSLKNRDLQGEVIPTQVSQESLEDDEEIINDGGSTEQGSNSRASVSEDEYEFKGDDDDDDDY